jgi:phosphatidylglycerophosphatase A
MSEPSRTIPFLSRFIATGFFSGYIPWASGTFGTAVGVLIYFIPGVESPAILLSLVVIITVVGAITAAQVARVEGHKLTKTAELAKEKFQGGEHTEPDPSIVVIDEIAGMLVSLLFLPKTWLVILIAFFAFRFFDIVKPYPARQLERVPNGWGIMLDDVVAGVYANLATHASYHAIVWLFPGVV